ncbi:hypothetical protein XENOCAPTIV_016412 [Xenoophorus captivus]|uniref:Uncharacterized protein n=1 Tax=Xenoophorus captivus TaxID=1517983 RepID=A0ABV0R0P5_9TELE
MDGEFDREFNDSCWGVEAPVWKTFKEQVYVVRQLVQQTQVEKQAEKLIKKMNQKIQEEVEKDGIDEKTRKSVGRWFWLNMKKAKKEKELAEEKSKDSGWFKGKFKETRDKAAKNETFWSQMVLIWQGGKYAMFDKPDTTHTEPHTDRNKETADKPPPYAPPPPSAQPPPPPTSPPTGLYPVLDVKEGHVTVRGLSSPQAALTSCPAPTAPQKKQKDFLSFLSESQDSVCN